jgi:hypothetical protein
MLEYGCHRRYFTVVNADIPRVVKAVEQAFVGPRIRRGMETVVS